MDTKKLNQRIKEILDAADYDDRILSIDEQDEIINLRSILKTLKSSKKNYGTSGSPVR